jgi:Cu(I)/Ag(I) efflux system membrane fusion protein
MDLVPVEEMGYAPPDDSAPAPLLVPATAPLITGRRAVVYVQVPGADRPTFEGREVVLGPRAGDRYIVESGLAEGERVVVNGAFKIDSAMQIQARPSMMSPSGDGAPTGAHRHGAGPSTGMPEFTAPDAFRAGLGTLAGSVMSFTSALAADDPVAAREAANRIGADFAAIPGAGLDEAARERWSQIEGRLRAPIQALEGQDGLAGPRELLPDLTAATVEAIRSFGIEIEGAVRRFHCPMAFDNAGADWLQSGESTANPYFGASMFRCGAQEELLAGAEQ